jgi:serine/threonine-protein kinase
MTETGTMLGTPYYMAPEQVFGEGDVDARADVWALGVMLFECLAGRKPFEGENFGQVFKAITMGAAPSLADACPGAPGELVDLAARMLSTERADRPAIGDVRETLARHADGSFALPEPTAIDALAVTLEAPVPTNSARAGRAGRWRVPALAATAGAAAVLALGVRALTSPVSSPAGALPPTIAPAHPVATAAPAPAPSPDPAPAPAPSPGAAPEAPAVAAKAPAPRPGVVLARARSTSPASPEVPASPANDPARLPGGVHKISPY